MILFIKKTVPLFLLILLSQSCANYKMNYTNQAKNWEERKPTNDLKIKHSVYLIGDTGNAKEGKTIPLFAPLKKELDKASENSSIIFLGDNIYPVGMPPKSQKSYRALTEHKLDVQLDMLDDYDGNIMFIPGNHDWYKYGLDGVKRQEKYIEKQLNEKRNGTTDDDDDEWQDYFFPGEGCGDPKVVEINDQLTIILIDSEWWLQNWDANQSINEGCEIKTRAAFFREFEEIVRKYRNRNVLIAMHHPLYSNGQHGGRYTLDNHIFPLRFINKGLYVPLPVLGTAIAFLRGTVGIPEDLANAKYKDMKRDILAGVRKNGSYILAAGHEHTLQYLEKDNQQYIVSGSGSKENAVAIGGPGEFSYGRLGYSKIDFYEDGSAWVHFYAMNDAKDNLQEVYRKKIRGKLEISKDNIPTSFPEFEKGDSVKIRKPTNFQFKLSNSFIAGIEGSHYANLYDKEYTFKTLDLSKYKGGVIPIKRGGGNQTNSLRLESPSTGHQYVMRALTKDASRALPFPFNRMRGAKDILQNSFMASHPFAALMVPDLSDAANVYHTNPELYYVPKQPSLDYHNDLFGGDVYLLEERPDDDWSEQKSFGNSSKIMSTHDVLDKIKKNRNHRVDQNWVVRSRLFDLMIKDWDRHEDQWRWARFEENGEKIYRPIPRDRDQPFSKYNGLMIWGIYAVNPFMRQLQPYSPDTKNLKWQGFNTTFFDKTFLNELEWEAWEKEAKFIQENMTDEIIETSLAKIPQAAKDGEWEQIVEFTKQRRNNLLKMARAAYIVRSEEVDVIGTEKKDLFEVIRLSDTQTKVKVYDLDKKGKKENLFYERVFNHDITKELHIYGLGDDDEFLISGEVNKSLKVRIIGGLGEDKIIDTSNVKSGFKKTLVYDSSEEENILELGKEGKDKTSEKVKFNTYDRRSLHHNPDYWIPLPLITFNPDDGLIIGANFSLFRSQFKKQPYGQKHNFSADYSFRTKALNFIYNCEYLESFKGWDVLTNLELRRNRFAFNYFGFGNETLNSDPDDLNFNRIRQSRIYADVLLQKRFASDNGTFSFGPLIERTKINNVVDRFIDEPTNELPNDIFNQRIYSGAIAKLAYSSLGEVVNPTKGMKFHLSYNVETNIENTDFTFGKLSTGLTIYQYLDRSKNFVFASELGYQIINGEFDFFKAPSIGGHNLRGHRAQRFRGNSVFYHMTDLRIRLLNSANNIVPFSFGIHGGFDYGKVWAKGIDSDKIHTSYGGGIWIDPLDVFVISLGQYVSKEESRFIFKLAHMF